MTKFTYAALSATSSVVLFGGALTLITPAPAKAFDWKAFGQAAAQELHEYGEREIERNSRQSTYCTTNYIGNTAYTNCY